MRNNLILATIFLAGSTLLTSCQAIADIFKAGMWVGVIVVVLIVALVLWLIGKMRR
ncbi:hypothetical protein [Segetibacter koreensis]|uniref:hypothetical protein n=1 Tax=Segetibacter koreensis TaxID=398037 RepID=UPI00146AD3D4|nr:hypothetical protein [Segetibacter koreensis]